jgi:hypothetical protein
MKVEVYGRSDDLIEIDGDVRAEFNTMFGFSDGAGQLAFSDGTVFTVDYNSDGFWKFRLEHEGDAEVTQEHVATQEDYTDRYLLDGTFDWVLLSTETSNFKRLEE